MEATSTDGALATLQQFMHAMTVGDMDTARSLLADDFVCYEAGGLPYSGTYHTPDGFFGLAGRIFGAMELTPGPDVQFLRDGDTIGARFRLTFTSRETGEKAEMSFVEVYTVRDGKIVELDVYYKDPSAVTALLAEQSV
jgi:uncharacterized protein